MAKTQNSDAEQKGINTPYHHRLAMGVKLDGTSLEPKGEKQPKQSGLAHTSKKK